MLSFTSDEIWQHLREQSSNNQRDRSLSPFTETYSEQLFTLDDNASVTLEDWRVMSGVRDAVAKSLELMRAAGDIGAALEAGVTIYASEHIQQVLAKTGDELRFVFITSSASVRGLSEKPDNLETQTLNEHQYAVEAKKASGEKCVRCWHLREDVGSHSEYPEICSRCVSNVHGDGETRQIA